MHALAMGSLRFVILGGEVLLSPGARQAGEERISSRDMRRQRAWHAQDLLAQLPPQPRYEGRSHCRVAHRARPFQLMRRANRSNCGPSVSESIP